MTDLATRPEAGDGAPQAHDADDDPQHAGEVLIEIDDPAASPADLASDEATRALDDAVDALPSDTVDALPSDTVDALPSETVDAAPSDTVAAPETDALPDSDTVPGSDGATPAGPPLVWAPSEPAPRGRRTGLWIAAGAAVAAVALVATSLVLIAPGTSVAGVGVGWHTPGAAAGTIEQRLAETTVVIAGPAGDVAVTGAELGAAVDTRGLAETAFAEHPMWNVTTWFGEPSSAIVRLDPVAATAALRAVAPDLYADPVDAVLAYDATSASYVVTPAVDGAGIDVDAVRVALQDAFDSGSASTTIEATVAPVRPLSPTYVADATAARLNAVLEGAGFYIGDERVVPVSREVAASWLTITPGDRGTYVVSADQAAIQEVVDTLAGAVDRPAVNEVVITDSGGSVLREEVAGVTGRTLGDSGAIASDYAAQLAEGVAAFQLPVDEIAFETVSFARRIEVNLSSQRTYLFENGAVVASYAISSGMPATPTPAGSFRVFAHVGMQDMGCYPGAEYCTEDVPWVTYFAPDIAFHGAYWHNNFGQRMSHGCVNMPVDIARHVYNWTPTGTEVWVHY